jgi:hydrogenase nickel incorporation protein HypA/HybF
MHEMGIANSILEAVAEEVRRYPGSRASKVGVRIGELTAIDAESLRFCFDALSQDTDLEGLQLQIELCSRRHSCDECGEIFTVVDYEFACPKCDCAHTRFISGDELELAYLEVEEHEPSALAEKSS